MGQTASPHGNVIALNYGGDNVDSGQSEVNPNQMEQEDIASEPICPQCHTTIVYRTKRKGILERILLYPVGYRAYRCEICDTRFCSKLKFKITSSNE
jgi:hypothetical protein